MKRPQECKEHGLWQNQLLAACLVLVSLTWYLILATDAFLLALTLAFLSLLTFTFRASLDLKHFQWHIQQAEEERNK